MAEAVRPGAAAILGESDLVAMVATADLERARTFYATVLGLELIDSNPFGHTFAAHGRALRVSAVSHLRPAPFTVAGWLVADVREAIAELARRGVRFEQFDRLEQDRLGVWTAPGGDMVAWFKDPDGNVL